MDQPKTTFKQIVLEQSLTNEAFAKIASLAGVEVKIVNNVYLQLPISRKQAERLLPAISQVCGQTFTFENMDIALAEEQTP